MLNFPSNAKMLAANQLHLKVDQLVNNLKFESDLDLRRFISTAFL